MITEYRKWLNKERITKEQALLLEDEDGYDIVYRNEQDCLIKKIEWYLNNELEAIEYYIGDDEDESEIVNTLSQQTDTICICESEVLGIYTLTRTRQYNNQSKLLFIGRSLEDNTGNLICLEYRDIITNLPIYEKTMKSFYKEGELLFEADGYNEDGSLDSITYMPDPTNEQNFEGYDAENFHILQSFFSEDISYYLTAKLEP